MKKAKEELVERIEAARERLNHSIDEKEAYQTIYKYSTELDELLNQYMVVSN